VGFLCGFVAKRTIPSDPVGNGGAAEKEVKRAGRIANTGSGAGAAARSAEVISTIRSTDTLEELMEAGGGVAYERLALWLLDAGVEEIEAYFEQHKATPGRDRDVTDLLMIAWTRVDPKGALAAVAGTGYEEYAWWAWAAHDPRAALEEVKATSPNRIPNVAWGIGEFHPEWLREHIDEIPASGRANALTGLAKWGETDAPAETLEFLKKHGWDPPPEMLGHYVRRDPWEAYEWMKERGASLAGQSLYGDSPMDSLLKLMGESHPEVLEQVAEQTPAGAEKREIEAILFESLMKEDFDAAMEVAKGTRAPRVAVERLAAVGQRLLRSDPERAFEIADSMLDMGMDKMQRMTRIVYSGGESSSWSGGGPAGDLLDMLLLQDPARVLTMVGQRSEAGVESSSPTTRRLAETWANRDVDGFAAWVDASGDPEIAGRYDGVILNHYRSEYRFEEAMNWWTGVGEPGQQNYVRVIQEWSRVDPEQARLWVEGADVAQEKKERMLKELGESQ